MVIEYIKNTFNEKEWRLVNVKKKDLTNYLTFQLIPKWSSYEIMEISNSLFLPSTMTISKWDAYKQGIIKKDYTHIRIKPIEIKVGKSRVIEK